MENIVDIQFGAAHSVCLTTNGKLSSFGCNDEGALGRETQADNYDPEPNDINIPGEVAMISTGDSHSACLLRDGRVFVWGSFKVIFFALY